MKYYALDEEDVKGFLDDSLWNAAGITLKKGGAPKDLKESVGTGDYEQKEEVAKEEEVVKEEEGVESEEDLDHSCPLCESKLENPISRELLEEFTNLVLEALNEATKLDEEDLDELTEEEAVEDKE